MRACDAQIARTFVQEAQRGVERAVEVLKEEWFSV